MPNRGSSPLVPPRLETSVVGSRIFVLEEVDSTSNYALRLGGDGTVIAANAQTLGRGRQGRSWHSAPGLGLWFSVAFEGHVEGLTFAAALAVRDALRGWCDVRLKWPNDVLLDGRKVCGILVEHRRARTALGIGINVHHQAEDFPEELRETATSLEMATGRHFSRAEILREVLTHLDRYVAALRDGEYERVRLAWASACDMQGRQVTYGDTFGVVSDIDAQGALIVETPQGAQRIVVGEVNAAD